ncbi:MAG: nuoG [Acidimicrobiales bacterium]|nr:nuoG [Acidimicrobiales bacterium]
MTDTAPAKTTFTITVDGKEIEALPGELLIAAAERGGTYIPRFCYHPRMRPVGMCRMCLVEVVGPRGPQLQPSCMIPVADGMVVDTESPTVKKAQDGMLELLLVNHPLDCPVCDKGGECPLQDQTLAFGPGESRFVEEKRHWEKPIDLSSLVALDRERCIQCDRCTRFADEVAGDPLIEFMGRGAYTEVNTFPDDPFASYFSGNTVQLCPVGALTAKPYRFKARPWDLDQVESTCTSCSVGCRMAVQSSNDRVVRLLGVDVDPVNHGWLCDKGRFDFEASNSDDRLTMPLVRTGDTLTESSWGVALAKVTEALSGAKDRHGAGSIAVLGGARLTNEDAYAWSKLARTVLGTDHVDAQLGDGLPAEVVLGLPRATIDEACSADLLVLLTGDLKEELPILYLRVRGAVQDQGLRVLEISPVETGMTRYAAASVRAVPGELASAVGHDTAKALLQGAGKVVCVLGRQSVAESADAVMDAAAALLEAVPGVTFLSGLRRANVHGALDMGLAPGVLPGRISLADGREWVGSTWGELPAEPGLDAHGILTAAAEGKLQGLVLLGADPLADFPDRDLARRALAGAGTVIAIDAFLTASSRQADVVLPAAIAGEKAGSTTNLEGRVSRLNQKITPPGTARADWMIAAELASRLGGDLGFESVAHITDEIAAVAPAYVGITSAALLSSAGFDGLLTGGLHDAHHEGPPSMGRGEAVEVDAVAAHGDNPTVEVRDSSPAPDQPDPSAGSEPHGDESSTAEAEAILAGGEGDHVEAVQKSAEAGESVATRPNRPAVLRSTPTVTRRAVPAVDGYSLRLVASHKLYDDGTLVQHSPSLAPLAPGSVVRVNPADLERLGVTAGDSVRVTSSRTALTLTTQADLGVPRGVAHLAFDQPGPGAADLIDAAAPVTDVRLETI